MQAIAITIRKSLRWPDEHGMGSYRLLFMTFATALYPLD